jgi:hypothetical protein
MDVILHRLERFRGELYKASLDVGFSARLRMFRLRCSFSDMEYAISHFACWSLSAYGSHLQNCKNSDIALDVKEANAQPRIVR